jgi:hypothetical protein
MISAIEATFTAFKKAANSFDFLIIRTKGFNKATNKKDGRNMPIVDTIAPLIPLIW